MALAKSWARNFKRRVGRAPTEGERRRAEFFTKWKKRMPKGLYDDLAKLMNAEHEESFRQGMACKRKGS
jgi:hypothetical protein